MKPLKPYLKLFVKLIILICITAVLCEVVFRVYHKVKPAFLFPSSSYKRFRGKPHAKDYDFKLNSRGFKDAEYAVQKGEGLYRILGIGDSCTFGVVPYRYNFLTILEEMFNRRNGNVEIINMGIPGVGVDSYFSILLKEGLELDPDLVITFFFIGNDFVDKTEKERGASYLFSFFRSLLRRISCIICMSSS